MPKITLLLLLLCFLQFSNAQGIKVGSKVEVLAVDGKVYKGTIIEIIHTAHRIQYDGYDISAAVWMTKDQFKLVEAIPVTNTITTTVPAINNGSTWQVGSRVEAYSAKKWYSGAIAEIKDGKYRIRYDGYGENWDTWVALNELRMPGTNGDVMISNDRAARGKLYLRHIRWLTGGTSLNWYFLADNGTIVVDPKHGVNPVDLVAERIDNMMNIGTYVISNNLMKVKWVNGTTSSVQVEYKNGDLSMIDALSIVMRQTGFPASQKLSGTYSGVLSAGSVAQGRTFTFSKTGSFTSANTGYVSTGVGNGIAEKHNSGNYSINGNTLTLNYADGKIEKAPIAIWDNRLVINNTSLPLIGN